MSSYTSDWRTAMNFSGLQGGGSQEVDLIMGAFVRKEDILSTPFTGFGCAREFEVVVLGHDRTSWSWKPTEKETQQKHWDAAWHKRIGL